MSKKTIITMNVVVMIMWLATIIINLLLEDISKFSYGACGFTLILSWVFKTVSDVRVYQLYNSKKELFKRCMQLFDEYTERLYKINTEEEEQ